MRLHASKLDLTLLLSKTSASSSAAAAGAAAVSSLLFEPSSRSLALMLSDSSALLFPSFSPFSSSSLSPAPTAVSRISTASCFLRLLPSGHVLFLSASPLSAGASIQLRAWSLISSVGATAPASFSPARLSFKSVVGQSAVSLNLRHGLSIRLAGSVNVFVLHSLAANQIWVFAAKPVAGAKDVSINLMKCAVIELTLPIYSITVSMGVLLLGEVNGVRVFPLRPLIKGKVVKAGAFGLKKSSSAMICELCRKNLPNGVVIPKKHVRKTSGAESGCSCGTGGSGLEVSVEDKAADGCCAPTKLMTVKLKQSSGVHFSFFVVMRSDELKNSRSIRGSLVSLKAVSIHVLSQNKFLILDSVGDLHFLNLHTTAVSSETTAVSSETTGRGSIMSKDVRLRRLFHSIAVQILAVLPDISAKIQVAWISDGGHSVHLISVTDIESHIDEIEKDGHCQKAVTVSAIEAIFTSGKVQNIVPLSATSVLVLCQGGIFAYAVI